MVLLPNFKTSELLMITIKWGAIWFFMSFLKVLIGTIIAVFEVKIREKRQ